MFRPNCFLAATPNRPNGGDRLAENSRGEIFQLAWIAITVTGRPALPADETRLLLLGLALVGPVGALGGFIARTWYPRLGGLVSLSAIAALAMLTRTILA